MASKVRMMTLINQLPLLSNVVVSDCLATTYQFISSNWTQLILDSLVLSRFFPVFLQLSFPDFLLLDGALVLLVSILLLDLPFPVLCIVKSLCHCLVNKLHKPTITPYGISIFLLKLG